MAECLKCHSEMNIEGTRFVCPNCGSQRDIVVPVPSQAELLKENTKLKVILGKVIDFLQDFIEYEEEETTFQKWAQRLIDDIKK